MICPNCKTELVEVNGRYICSDCGREIPENEVMASDWGNGDTARAGLYGAGTDDTPEPEEGSKVVNDADVSLTDVESKTDEPSVEEILQEQTTKQPEPAQPEPATEAAVPDAGFYTPEASAQNIESGIENKESEGEPTIPLSSLVASQGPSPEPVITTSTPVIPAPTPVIPTEAEESLSNIPEGSLQQGRDDNVEVSEAPKPQVVKDMFENTEAPVAPDPGIYTDPMYENNQVPNPPQETPAAANVPMPADKKINLAILIIGTILVLALLVGGIWSYLALTSTGV